MASLVSGAQSQIQAQNGRFLLWYTRNIVASWQNASTCYTALSNGGMNDKNYFAGNQAPAAFVNKIQFAGTAAFINLKTGVLMGMDSQGNYLTNQQLINWATQANQ